MSHSTNAPRWAVRATALVALAALQANTLAAKPARGLGCIQPTLSLPCVACDNTQDQPKASK